MIKTVKKIYRLRLLSGNHTEHDPVTNEKKVWKQNDTVESEFPLHKKFKNKFQLLEVVKEKAEIEDTQATASNRPKPSARKPKRTRARVVVKDEDVEVDELPDEEVVSPEEFEPEERLKPVHRGGGRYIVFNEVTGKPVHEGTLSKAKAFELAGLEVPK